MVKGIEFKVLPDRLTKEDVYAAEREAYIKGKEDAAQELPRQGSVYYSDNKHLDLYNMGYSYEQR